MLGPGAPSAYPESEGTGAQPAQYQEGKREEEGEPKAWSNLGKWGLCTITPNPEHEEALRRASRGFENDKLSEKLTRR